MVAPSNGLKLKTYAALSAIMAALLTVAGFAHVRVIEPAIETKAREVVSEAIEAHSTRPHRDAVTVRELQTLREDIRELRAEILEAIKK